MKPFRIHAEARAEIEAAIEHYENQRAGLGREFLDALALAISQIRQMPQTFAKIDAKETRKHSLKRFPFTVYYVDHAEEIWIAAVAHQKRRPGYWSSRGPTADHGA